MDNTILLRQAAMTNEYINLLVGYMKQKNILTEEFDKMIQDNFSKNFMLQGTTVTTHYNFDNYKEAVNINANYQSSATNADFFNLSTSAGVQQ